MNLARMNPKVCKPVFKINGGYMDAAGAGKLRDNPSGEKFT